MKQVAQAPQRPSTINPQVSPALDAITMRALEKEPGPALPERRRLHRRPRRGAQGPRRGNERHRRLRAAAADRGDPGGAGGGGLRGGGAPRAAAASGCWSPRGADRPPAGLRADPRHDHRSADVTGSPESNGRSRCCAKRLQDRRDPPRAARSAGQHRARAGPGRVAARGRSGARLRLPQLLLLEAESGSNGERRAGQRQDPLHRRRRRGPKPKKRSKARASTRRSNWCTPRRSKKGW